MGKIIYSALFSITTLSSSSSLLDSSSLKRHLESIRSPPSILESKKQRIDSSPPGGYQSLDSTENQGFNQGLSQDPTPAIFEPSDFSGRQVSSKDTVPDRLTEKFGRVSISDSGVPKKEILDPGSNDPGFMKRKFLGHDSNPENFNTDSNPKSNLKSNRIGGSNTGSTELHEKNALFDLNDALNEESLEMDALHGKDEIENVEEAGEPSAKAVKSDNAKVPVHLWDDRIAAQLTIHWQQKGIWSKRWNFRRQ